MGGRFAQIALGACLVTCHGLSAQPVPAGGEFGVNVVTAGLQNQPAVARAEDGRFVVVWNAVTAAGGDADGPTIRGRIYSAAGVPGSEFQVNSHFTGQQLAPAVAMQPDGGFVVAWTSDDSPGSDPDFAIVGRRFLPGGLPAGPDFQVNSYTTGNQYFVDLASDPDGRFVAAWASNGSPGSDVSGTPSVQARAFFGDAAPRGAQFQVNVLTTGVQTSPSVAAGTNGDFVVVWESDVSNGGDTSGRSIQARRFRADGSALDAGEQQVNFATAGQQQISDVAADGRGGFVVAWGSDLSAVFARRFGASGSPLDVGDVALNTAPATVHAGPSVSADAAGNFFVAWQVSDATIGSDTDDEAVFARRFTAGGTPVDAAEFVVNTFTTGGQYLPAVAADLGGDAVVVWTSQDGQDGDAEGVYAQRYRRPTILVTTTDGGLGVAGCSLREAMFAAQAPSNPWGCAVANGGAVIELVAGSTIDLSQIETGDTDTATATVTTPVTLRGQGSTVRRAPALACPGAPEFRLFEVGPGGHLLLEDLTLSGGCLASAGSGGNLSAFNSAIALERTVVAAGESEFGGGGLATSDAALRISRSTVRDNFDPLLGGGLLNSGAASRTRILDSTLSGNESLLGGGAWLQGWTSIRNSTFSGNFATVRGGGLVLSSSEPVLLDFVTVTGNESPLGAGISFGAVARVRNSLVGDNIGADCHLSAGSVTGLGINLDTDGSCDVLAPGSFFTAPTLGLGPLAANGGPTETHLPLAESFASDNASDCLRHDGGSTLAFDQRGLRRSGDDDDDLAAECDLGAVEGQRLFGDGFGTGSANRWSASVPP